jgi:hypothetical protein
MTNVYRSTLLEYRDKIHIYNVLTSKASDYYGTLKLFVNIPIIISSSAAAIINSSFAPEDMQIPNICINACTALLIGLINNFKIVEQSCNFRNTSSKFLKLLHLVEDKLTTPDLDIEC